MAKGIHHVACSTSQPDALVDFLVDVVGLPSTGFTRSPSYIGELTLGWPAEGGLIFGEGRTGRVEIAPIPPELQSTVHSGVSALAIATPNLARVLAGCRARGLTAQEFTVTDPNNPIAGVTVEVAGIRFLFEHFL